MCSLNAPFVGLYRWYVSRSQTTRSWNPNTDFDWRSLRTDHSTELNHIIEGFCRRTICARLRAQAAANHSPQLWPFPTSTSAGDRKRKKHSDLWENAAAFLRYRSPEWIADYKVMLRENAVRFALGRSDVNDFLHGDSGTGDAGQLPQYRLVPQGK